MLKGRGRTQWTDEEKQIVLEIMMQDPEYQKENGSLDYTKMAYDLNVLYHDRQNIRYKNSVKSFIAHTKMSKTK